MPAVRPRRAAARRSSWQASQNARAVRRIVPAAARRRPRRPAAPGRRPTPSRSAWATRLHAVGHRRPAVAGGVEHLLPAVDVERRPRRRTPTPARRTRFAQRAPAAAPAGRAPRTTGRRPRPTTRHGSVCSSITASRRELDVGTLGDLDVRVRSRLELLRRRSPRRRAGRRRLVLGVGVHAGVARRVEGAPGAVGELELHPRHDVAVVDDPARPGLGAGDHPRRARRGGRRPAPSRRCTGTAWPLIRSEPSSRGPRSTGVLGRRAGQPDGAVGAQVAREQQHPLEGRAARRRSKGSQVGVEEGARGLALLVGRLRRGLVVGPERRPRSGPTRRRTRRAGRPRPTTSALDVAWL